MAEGIERLKPYLSGWKAYFHLAQTPDVWRTLKEWLRTVQLKHRRRDRAIHRELVHLDAAEHVTRRVAQNAYCLWRNCNGDIKGIPTIAYFDRRGLPRLS